LITVLEAHFAEVILSHHLDQLSDALDIKDLAPAFLSIAHASPFVPCDRIDTPLG